MARRHWPTRPGRTAESSASVGMAVWEGKGEGAASAASAASAATSSHEEGFSRLGGPRRLRGGSRETVETVEVVPMMETVETEFASEGWAKHLRQPGSRGIHAE
jgi:hypothetical protein